MKQKIQNLMYGLVIADLPAATLPVTGQAITLSEIQDRVTQIAQFMIVVGLVIAVIFIVWGGIRYMMSRGDAKKAAEARGVIINGLIGAGVILAVGVLLQTVAGLVTRTFFS